MRRLLLGPIVGHTDEQSATVWARMSDEPALYTLRVRGVGSVPFVSTEAGGRELGTAIATIGGLQPDRRHHYQVLRRGRVIRGARGSFRTMPSPGSMAPSSFLFVSCNHQVDPGAWAALAKTIEDFQPRFLLMMGDQVYIDQSGDVWESHLHRPRSERRRALAQKYQDNWSDPVKREIMANIPTYMMWDDHEIRDGWGSWAPDSPTLAGLHPKGMPIFARYDEFFQDARDVFWHFQMSHNPPVPRPAPGVRAAMPFTIRSGRISILVLDSRGARDVWRPSQPVLGAAQWQSIEEIVATLPAEIDVLAIMTPTPIVSMSPRSLAQLGSDRLEHLAPDVRLFRRGAEQRLDDLVTKGGARVAGRFEGNPVVQLAASLQRKVQSKIDEVRDQWSHRFSRPEQEALIRVAVRAGTINRVGAPREVLFLGGDIHMGAVYDVTVSGGPTIPCLVSSGISQAANKAIDGVVAVDQDFEVAPGIRAHQRQLIQDYNYGLIQVIPTGGTPEVIPAIVHAGNATSVVGQVGRWR